MLVFLIAVLIFALGVGLNAQPAVAPEEISENIEELISHVEEPQGNPTIPPENLANNQNGNSNSNGGNENGNGENGGSQNGNGNGQNGQPSNLPKTTLVAAYNTAGGVVINQVPVVAVDNSPVLDSCTDEPKLCENPEGPGNSQNAPVGPPNNGGPVPHDGQANDVPPQEVPPVNIPQQAENGLAQAAVHRP